MFTRREKMNTLGAFRDFAESSIWADIQKELADWLDDIHLELEDHMTIKDGGLSDKILHRLGGNAEFSRRAMNIVPIIIEQLEQDKEGEEDNGSR